MSAHTPGPWGWSPSDGDPEGVPFSVLVRYAPSTAPEDGEWDDVVLAVLDDVPLAEDYVEGGGRDYVAWNVSEANARLIAAAPDLLAAQTMGASMNTPDFLDCIADRLVSVHGENPNVDFVLSLRERAEAGRAAIAKAVKS